MIVGYRYQSVAVNTDETVQPLSNGVVSKDQSEELMRVPRTHTDTSGGQ